MIRNICLFIYHLFSISCRMNGEYLWCFKRESKRRERQDLTEEQNRIGIFLSKHSESEEKCKEILLRGLVGLFQEQFFVARKGCIKGCSKIFIFPAKKLRKIRCSKIRMRRFFFNFVTTLLIISHNPLVIFMYFIKQVNKLKRWVLCSLFNVSWYTH